MSRTEIDKENKNALRRKHYNENKAQYEKYYKNRMVRETPDQKEIRLERNVKNYKELISRRTPEQKALKKERDKEYNKKYYKDNKELYREPRKKYYEDNIEKVKAYSKKAYKERTPEYRDRLKARGRELYRAKILKLLENK